MNHHLTPWTPQYVDEYVNWHERVISVYPGATVINGRLYNVQQELRNDRIKWLGTIPKEQESNYGT